MPRELVERLLAFGHSAPGIDLVAPLAGLLVLRWAAFVEAETEAVSAFNDVPFLPLLPEALRQPSWTDAHGLASRLRGGLPEISRRQDVAVGRYLGAVAPSVLKCAEGSHEIFAALVDWVAGLTFETAEGRDAAASAFDAILARVVEGLGNFGGEFTTPRPVADLMVELVDPKPGDRVYDPCFGVGGLLVEAARRLRKAVASESPLRWGEVRNNGIFGVEINAASYAIGLCRVVLAGIDKPGLELGDALGRPLPRNRAVEGFDCILAAPPWGGRLSDARARQYPVPTGGMENLFLQHVMANLRPGGRAVIALPEGTLFRTGPDRRVRRTLLEEYRVDGVVSLPEGAFAPCTAVPSSLVVFRRDSPRPEVRFVSVPAEVWRSSAVAVASGVAAGPDRASRDASRPAGNSSVLLVGDPAQSVDHFVTTTLARDISGVLRGDRASLLHPLAGLTSWDVASSVLESRDYELLAKQTGADPVETMLQQIVTADSSITIAPLRQVATIARGVSYDRTVASTSTRGEGTVGLLRVGDFAELGAKAPSMRLTREGASRLKESQVLRAGDVAVTLSGTVGKTALISSSAGTVGVAASNGIAVIRCKSDIQAPFLAALLRSPAYQSWLRGHAHGMTIQHLSLPALGTLPVPLAPLAIQDAVLRHVEPRGDALALLLRFSAGAASDPISAWLERPGVVGLISETSPGTDVARVLSAAGQELLELRHPLMNRAVSNQEPLFPESVARWAVEIVEAGAALAGIDTVPKGAPRIAALELAKNRLGAARATLTFDDDEPSTTAPRSRSAGTGASSLGLWVIAPCPAPMGSDDGT